MSIRMQAARPGMTLWLVVLLITLAIIGLVVVAAGVLTAKHPECQHTTPLGEVSIAGPITNVPEFHDCQRLITAGQYGPVVAVWVSKRSNQLYTDMWPAQLPPLQNPDTVLVAPDLADTLAATGTTPRSVPVVQIYNYGDPVEFAAIGELPSGFTCVYFILVQDSMLGAWTNSTGTTDDCSQAEPTQPPVLIPVTRVALGFTEADYPPVARWEWDSVQGRHVLGVKCGAAWCRLGPPRMTVQHHASLIMSAGQNAPVFSIPGWYDEQVLSAPGSWNWMPLKWVRTDGFLGYRPRWVPRKLVPSGVLGTIFPDAGLDSLVIDDYFERWVRVAEVHLSEPSEHYRKKLNFVHHTGQPAAVIHLRHNTKHDTWPVQESRDEDWEAAIVSSAGDTIFRKVIWRGYHDSPMQPGWVPVPGTVRWRWLEVDETTWEWCPEGCCETMGKS